MANAACCVFLARRGGRVFLMLVHSVNEPRTRVPNDTGVTDTGLLVASSQETDNK